MNPIPNCGNKVRLLAEYQAASEAYSKAISDLSDSACRTPRSEYEGLNLLVKRARIFAEACKNLDLHTYQHGC